ncbi:MAG: pseudouridine synthase [Limnohabitans sp.]|nr:pseudouridine synthase [Limnohabitans sp.]
MDLSKPLPMHDGVSASRVSLPAGHWPTVLEFLCERFAAVDKEEWVSRILQGHVLHGDGSAVTLDEPYLAFQAVFYYRHLAHEATLPENAQVLFEDEYLLVADKPHFMPVTPGGRYLQSYLLVQLKRLTACESLTPIHRINRETAGLVVFCKRAQDRDAYHALFRRHLVHKWYEAVAAFDPDLKLPLVHRSRLVEAEKFFLSHEVPGEPNSETRVSLLQRTDVMALYQLQPLTGQRHQLRIHMMSLGVPIAGDQLYPQLLRGPDEADDFSRPMQLLARRIAFKDPVTGEERDWQSLRSLQITKDQ